jgi:hypothetical protein
MGEYAFLAVYRNSYGMAFTNLRDAGNGMTTAWLILGVEWIIFMSLAWYLEQVCYFWGVMLSGALPSACCIYMYCMMKPMWHGTWSRYARSTACCCFYGIRCLACG